MKSEYEISLAQDIKAIEKERESLEISLKKLEKEAEEIKASLIENKEELENFDRFFNLNLCTTPKTRKIAIEHRCKYVNEMQRDHKKLKNIINKIVNNNNLHNSLTQKYTERKKELEDYHKTGTVVVRKNVDWGSAWNKRPTTKNHGPSKKQQRKQRRIKQQEAQARALEKAEKEQEIARQNAIKLAQLKEKRKEQKNQIEEKKLKKQKENQAANQAQSENEKKAYIEKIKANQESQLCWQYASEAKIDKKAELSLKIYHLDEFLEKNVPKNLANAFRSASDRFAQNKFGCNGWKVFKESKKFFKQASNATTKTKKFDHDTLNFLETFVKMFTFCELKINGEERIFGFYVNPLDAEQSKAEIVPLTFEGKHAGNDEYYDFWQRAIKVLLKDNEILNFFKSRMSSVNTNNNSHATSIANKDFMSDAM